MHSIEKSISDTYQRISEAIEEQTRLLRQVVDLLQQQQQQHVQIRNNKDTNSSREEEEEEEEEKDTMNHVSVTNSTPATSATTTAKNTNETKNGDGKTMHRLQKMSKATDHDAEMVQAQETELRRKALQAANTSTMHHQSNNSRRDKGMASTLEERKKEFVKKTVPAGEVSATKNKKSKTLLAVAAAKREMERERKRLRRAQEEEEDHQGGASILTWIAYGLIGMAGVASLVLGIVARITHMKYMHHETVDSEL